MGFSVSTVHHIGYQGRPLGSRRASRAELGTYAEVLKELGKGVIEITLLDVPGSMSDAEFDLLDFLLTESARPVTWITSVLARGPSRYLRKYSCQGGAADQARWRTSDQLPANHGSARP